MLELINLGTTLGNNTFNFHLTLEKSESIAVLGKSGSGKSTLLNLVGGFLTASHGKLLFNGKALDHLPPAKRPLTTLFQEHNLFAHLSIADNIGLGLHPGLKLSVEQHKSVSHVLEQVGLMGFENRRPTELSGGQAQRAGLARCLIRNKPVLLLDEPFSALDDQTREQMLSLTKSITQENKIATLFVTHNKADALAFAERHISIINGTVHQG